MLQSTKITRRQSEIRQSLAELAGKDSPTEDETRQMGELDGEYQSNETRLRAALTAEDTERRDAGNELETREERDWSALMDKFEVRSVFANVGSGDNAPLTGATKEIVDEMRSNGAFRGTPIPWEILERRAGETTSATVPSPTTTAPIIDALFPGSVMAQMGTRMINIPSSSNEYPVNTSKTSVAWASTEGGNVADSTEYVTENRTLSPNHTMGATLSISRRAQLQAAGIEAAIRRNARDAMQAEMDRVVFQGKGTGGEPSGVISKASSYGIESTAVDASATYAAYRTAAINFMLNNAATSVGNIRALLRPELMDGLDGQIWDAGSGITELDRLIAKFGSVVFSHNALKAPTGSPEASKSLLTTTAGGTEPIFLGRWSGVDVVRDVYTGAQSGELRITLLATLDLTVTRPEQLQVLSGLQA